MVDVQRIEYVSRTTVQRRIARRLSQAGVSFRLSHGIYYIDKDDRVACIDCEQLARMLCVLRSWERIECYWAKVLRASIEKQRRS